MLVLKISVWNCHNFCLLNGNFFFFLNAHNLLHKIWNSIAIEMTFPVRLFTKSIQIQFKFSSCITPNFIVGPLNGKYFQRVFFFFIFYLLLFHFLLNLNANINLRTLLWVKIQKRKQFFLHYFVKKHINSFSCFIHFSFVSFLFMLDCKISSSWWNSLRLHRQIYDVYMYKWL